MVPSKKELRFLEDFTREHYQYSDRETKLRALRTACYANLLINLQLLTGQPTNEYLARILRDSAREFKDSPSNPEIAIMYPLLKQQVGRLYLLRRERSVRKFVYNCILVASYFNGLKALHLENFAVASYIIAAKYYESMGLNSWNLILEFTNFNLAGIFFKMDDSPKALYHYVATLNETILNEGQLSTIGSKTLARSMRLAIEAQSSEDPATKAKA